MGPKCMVPCGHHGLCSSGICGLHALLNRVGAWLQCDGDGTLAQLLISQGQGVGGE